MTTIILFKCKGKSYRMRLSCIHQSPGDRDTFEVSGVDMLSQASWRPVPDGSSDIPSGEWIARRALWYLVDGGHARSTEPEGRYLKVIDLEELGV